MKGLIANPFVLTELLRYAFTVEALRGRDLDLAYIYTPRKITAMLV